ncbi:hypothetical protein KIN20_021198 [Parelaphostrongylus tenuis]|uniref:Uncharacterized protein n=1 Tax=Parelaphostrongylus tenuis TaxID=148309 RepID=A0AAD5QRE6_PARTN|nr:hypothetical protein KIN20_021198 [Parelaphostrongylus tenuis]
MTVGSLLAYRPETIRVHVEPVGQVSSGHIMELRSGGHLLSCSYQSESYSTKMSEFEEEIFLACDKRQGCGYCRMKGNGLGIKNEDDSSYP